MLDLLKNAIAEIKGDRDRETSPDAPQKFVILSIPRTGSNFLCNALDAHPEVLCHYELFNKDKIYYSGSYLKHGGRDLGTVQDRERSLKIFLDRIWEQSFDFKAIGFKLFIGHNQKAFDSVLKNKNVKKILLRRENILKTYVSHKIARKKNAWAMSSSSSKERERNKQQLSIIVKPKYLYDYIKNIDKFYGTLDRKLKASNQTFLEITYEELFGSESEAVKSKILKFIGVSTNLEYFQSNLKKQNTQHLSQLIKNFSELEAALKGTELEPYLDSPDFG